MPEDDALKRLMQSKRPSVSPRQESLTPKLPDVSTSLSQSADIDLPEVVRTTVRLEESVDKALRQLCLEAGLTKEVWFEAAYLYLAQHPQDLEAVNQMAHERLERRKRAADVRKLRTMQKRLSGEG
ncbi:hypothetical protein NDI39_31360 [Microcoleus sp. ZQ-A2]|nr:hypothetical protein [Microcoleus sp. FACHB-1]